MKKIKYLGLLVVCLFIFIVSINASEPKTSYNIFPDGYNSDFSVEPSVFDFSKIAFASSDSETSIVGDASLRKILSYYTVDCDAGDTECTDGVVDYFTSYCLDGNKKYPIYSLVYNNMPIPGEGPSLTDEEVFKIMVLYQFFKECTASTSCTLLDDIDGYEGVDYSGFDSPDAATLTDFLEDDTVIGSLTEVAILLKDPTKGVSGIKTITAAQMATALGTTFPDSSSRYEDDRYFFQFKKSDFNANHYEVSDMPTSIGYNRALWIIEHSYPNLDLEKSLIKAGTTLSAVRTDVQTLEATTLNAITDPTEKEAKLVELVQNYVYSITQYAIWKSVGDYYKVVGSTKITLGDELVVNGSYSVPASLNTLYKYYIEDRDEYTNYATTDISQSFTVTNPDSGKELYQTTTNSYIYGPYVITGNTLYTTNIEVSVTSPTSGVTLIDKSGNALSQINDGGEIYLEVLKSAKPTKVVLTLTTDEAYVFKTNLTGTARGRLFTSESMLDQTVATGARLMEVNYSRTAEILLNPKTGVENIGTIFLVALIAFTLGYIILRFKQEPVKEL